MVKYLSVVQLVNDGEGMSENKVLIVKRGVLCSCIGAVAMHGGRKDYETIPMEPLLFG